MNIHNIYIYIYIYIYVYVNQNWIHSHFENISTTVVLNFTILHVYNSYLTKILSLKYV